MAFFAPDQTPALTHSWTDDDVHVASSAAIHFIKAFYQSMDNVVERLPLLARFYSDRSTMIWNGTKATGMSEIGALIKDVPPSRTDPLSVDCHPIAGTPYPRLLITVQGLVTHTPPAQLTSHALGTRLAKAFYTPVNDTHTYPDIPAAVHPDPVPDLLARQGGSTRRTDDRDGEQPPVLSQHEVKDLTPRIFHEVFVLANVDEAVSVTGTGEDGRPVPPARQPNQQPVYTILSDTFRFVG
ncbi:hypothetical protein NliqN6_6417 [Naganishia liquefaciens]|uniref:NTF2 domain-containing protein n=1 Tax=Naganishia liquefaciens TaxID=104408 RepID=A0A8H3U031_9TREE|nr:hypothetical protein NliqN6_6417 [Naganishia liquefaciens]